MVDEPDWWGRPRDEVQVKIHSLTPHTTHRVKTVLREPRSDCDAAQTREFAADMRAKSDFMQVTLIPTGSQLTLN